MDYKDITKNIRESMGLPNDEAKKETLTEAFVAQPKKFDLGTEKLSQKTKTAHLELYNNYISCFNRTSAELDGVQRDDANSSCSLFRDIKLAEQFNMGAVYLHELYFANIASHASELSMDSLTYMRLARDWGSFDLWQRDFIACAMSARSGWAVCCYNTYLEGYINVIVDGHVGNVPMGCIPVIVMDMWEHAYYKDYLNNKKQYLYNMMSELNWDVIENRVKRAERMAQVAR